MEGVKQESMQRQTPQERARYAGGELADALSFLLLFPAFEGGKKTSYTSSKKRRESSGSSNTGLGFLLL